MSIGGLDLNAIQANMEAFESALSPDLDAVLSPDSPGHQRELKSYPTSVEKKSTGCCHFLFGKEKITAKSLENKKKEIVVLINDEMEAIKEMLDENATSNEKLQLKYPIRKLGKYKQSLINLAQVLSEQKSAYSAKSWCGLTQERVTSTLYKGIKGGTALVGSGFTLFSILFKDENNSSKGEGGTSTETTTQIIGLILFMASFGLHHTAEQLAHKTLEINKLDVLSSEIVQISNNIDMTLKTLLTLYRILKSSENVPVDTKLKFMNSVDHLPEVIKRRISPGSIKRRLQLPIENSHDSDRIESPGLGPSAARSQHREETHFDFRNLLRVHVGSPGENPTPPKVDAASPSARIDIIDIQSEREEHKGQNHLEIPRHPLSHSSQAPPIAPQTVPHHRRRPYPTFDWDVVQKQLKPNKQEH